MFFREDQLVALELQLKDVPLQLRQAWFEECLRLRRRRARYLWMDTPVARLFTPQEEWSTLRSHALLKALRVALREKARLEDVEALERAEWGYDALRNHLLRMRLGFAASDLQEAVSSLSVSSQGSISKDTVEEALQVQEALRALRDLEGLKAARRAQAEAERMDKASRVWQCQNCTFMNSALSATCAVCDFGWTGQRECPADKYTSRRRSSSKSKRRSRRKSKKALSRGMTSRQILGEQMLSWRAQCQVKGRRMSIAPSTGLRPSALARSSLSWLSMKAFG